MFFNLFYAEQYVLKRTQKWKLYLGHRLWFYNGNYKIKQRKISHQAFFAIIIHLKVWSIYWSYPRLYGLMLMGLVTRFVHVWTREWGAWMQAMMSISFLIGISLKGWTITFLISHVIKSFSFVTFWLLDDDTIWFSIWRHVSITKFFLANEIRNLQKNRE